ncbi:peptidoglycan-recognition protein precursor [Nasonia vitripennis]|uniref:Uncharacterized protein n=1 Tax=Nasonia vitripennis TaxID=7425 RepID=A0A7M6UM42_NASVI|nr:peptidoglycan-recognition protein precursor [Nasonia vitripennis]
MESFTSPRCFLIGMLVAISIFAIGFHIVTAQQEKSDNEIDNDNEKGDSNGNYYNNLKIVKREEWEALEPKKPPKKLQVLPAPFVIISQTNTQACRLRTKCVKSVRNLQISALTSALQDDISFNFLVGGDGRIYEGRGWDVEGQHTVSHTNRSIRLAFIGQFETDDPAEPQVSAAIKLIEYGVKNRKISEDYHVKALKQVNYFNENPGDNLYKIIKNWEHWDPSSLGNESTNVTDYSDKKFRENSMYGWDCKPVVTTTFRSGSRLMQGPRVSCVMREIKPNQSHVPNFVQRPNYFPKYGN